MEQTCHPELKDNLATFISILQDEPDLQSDDVELEFKQGFLKFSKDEESYACLLKKSWKKPVVLKRHYQRKHIINAGCSMGEHTECRNVLDKLVLNKQCEMQIQKILFMNCQGVRYEYNCRGQSWSRIKKNNLIDNPVDLIYRSKQFRLNISQKIIKADAGQTIQKICQKNQKQVQLLRFIHTNIYKVHPLYSIWSSAIFQTDSYFWINKIKKLVAEKANKISSEVLEIIDQNQSQIMKYELQLRFTKAGVDFLRKGMNTKSQAIFSKAFDFLNELTGQDKSTAEISSLLESLKIQNQTINQKPLEKKQEATSDQQEEDALWKFVKKSKR